LLGLSLVREIFRKRETVDNPVRGDFMIERGDIESVV